MVYELLEIRINSDSFSAILACQSSSRSNFLQISIKEVDEPKDPDCEWDEVEDPLIFSEVPAVLFYKQSQIIYTPCMHQLHSLSSFNPIMAIQKFT